jgi:NAD(P)-dependent dehydrogenase (short-subunit alcohol dehydrogenase family)
VNRRGASSPRHRRRERLLRNPLGHLMQPEDLVGAVLFLVSDGAAYIIGPAINVNCGTVMI